MIDPDHPGRLSEQAPRDEWGRATAPSRWIRVVEDRGWLLLAIVGLILFVFTPYPALAFLLGSSVLGWEEAMTSRWLGRRDPDPVRGRATSRLYAAYALWRVSFVALATTILDVMIVANLETKWAARKVAGPDWDFIRIGLTMLGVFFVASIVTMAAAITAFRSRVRVWVGPHAVRARKLGVWPPSHLPPRPGHLQNRATWLVSCGISFLIGVLAVFTLRELYFRVDLEKLGMPGWILWALVALVMLVVGVSFMAIRETFENRVAARSIADCWPMGQAETPLGGMPDLS